MADISIYTIEDLASINGSGARTGTHTLMRSLDFNDDASYANPGANKATYTTGSGWAPLGTIGTGYYAGTFEGNGNTISNIYAKDRECVGLFGVVDSCTIRNVGVINPSFNQATTGNYTKAGGLIGGIDAEGTVLIENCYSSGGTVGSDDYVGGLIGIFYMWVGGNTTIRNCWSTTNTNEKGSFQDGQGFGGFIGSLNLVSGGGSVVFQQCYAAGLVGSGASTNTGGFCGFQNISYTMTNCFWDTQTSGKATSVGATGKTTSEMKMLTTFSGASWDITDEVAYFYPTKWFIRDGSYYPKLSMQYPAYDISAAFGL